MPTHYAATDSPGMKRIVAALVKFGPMNDIQLAEKACLGVRSFRSSYRVPMLNAQLAHVCEWRRREGTGGLPEPVYKAGPQVGRKAKRPVPLTQSECHRRWREKTGYNEFKAAQKRIAKPKIADPVLAALMGRAA